MPVSLDQPPPAPPLSGAPGTGMSPTPQAQGFGGLAPGGQSMGGLTPEIVQGVMQMGAQIDQSLVALAQAVPIGAAEFQQAQQLIQAGLAKFLQAGAGATTPTATGTAFPGGGFQSGMP